nr:MAG TPA: major capsid protein [Caudoviricetes sp.]
MPETYDFQGRATAYNVRCTDGRTILPNAFKDCTGKTVPLVWNHQHNSVGNVLGHALLENRDDGVYAYGKFNNTEDGQAAKELVRNGDIKALSIYANHLKESAHNVMHGAIRELSLVLAGANPEAYIESVMCHDDESLESAMFWAVGSTIQAGPIEVETSAEISHGDDPENTEVEEVQTETSNDESDHEDTSDGELDHADSDENKNDKTIGDIVKTMNEEQKNAMYYLIAKAKDDDTDDNTDSEKGGDESMSHNVFEKNGNSTQGGVLSHAEIDTIFKDAKRAGSLREGVLAHAEEYGITNIDYLFPEAKSLTTTPEFIKRDTGWVSKVMNAVGHTPFSRIKTVFADITEDEARAKGYLKGKLKKEEVFSLLKRSTAPTTIYKKQKIDRDDVIDIVDFDVVAWIKAEMRMMLDEEIARAILLGDGRLASSDDKIDENCIRPVAKDAELYSIHKTVDVANGATDEAKAKQFIRTVIKSRKDYKGSGNPTLYITEDLLADMLLLEDGIGHLMYASEAQLATTLRVKEIITIPVMEGQTGVNEKPLVGILVNLADYKVGADKGGSVNMFDDFDIDYNQQKYLIETRASGALVKPYSAITYEMNVAAA